MAKVNAGWTVLDSKLPLLTYHYSFGPGRANALAIGGDDGLIVISPPYRAPEAAFTELEAHGKIRALVASNAFHYLGLPAWKARYPDAKVFAPAQSIARVEKRSRIAGILPLAEAKDISGGNVELIDMPHYKTGEVLVRANVGSEIVWYVTDVIMNMPKLPGPFPFSLIFKWSGSAPGLRLNGVAPLFMVKDKRALHRWLRDEAAEAPPSVLVPCHGDVVRMANPGKELLALFS
jgi:hypothetical protein